MYIKFKNSSSIEMDQNLNNNKDNEEEQEEEYEKSPERPQKQVLIVRSPTKVKKSIFSVTEIPIPIFLKFHY